MITVSECKDAVDLILEIEAGELRVDTMEELERVKNLCKDLSSSQGFYGRLLRALQDISEYDLPIVL